MYKEFKLKDDILYITDDDGNVFEFSNSSKWLEYFENKNNIEMLENKLNELINIKDNIHKEHLRKYSKNFFGVLFGIVLMLSFFIKIVFSYSPILLLGVALSSFLTLKSFYTMKTDKCLKNINEIIDLQVELENVIKKIMTKNNNFMLSFLNENLDDIEEITVNNGIVKYDNELENKYSVQIEKLRKIKEKLEAEEKQKTLIK